MKFKNPLLLISGVLLLTLTVSSAAGLFPLNLSAEDSPAAIAAATIPPAQDQPQGIVEFIDGVDLQIPPNWWVNMIAAAGGVLIAYGVYFLRLRAVARQRKILEDEVAERTAALKILNQELDREIQRRAEFNRALVHELKTPLTAILASAELFVEELKGDPHLGLAKNIYQAARNLDRRTDELLDVSRGEIGILAVNPKTERIQPLLLQTVDTLKPAAARKHHSLSIDIVGDLPAVAIDEERLRQVLYNYLANAIKYTPEGGNIQLKAYRVYDELRVEVTDDGPGISKEDQQLLFEPYYQVPRNGGERLGGLGLGLSLSKMIVGLHGGRVWVESKPDEGSTFGFAIPVALYKGENTT
ncbi:MAG: HAMP domain-containing sensor histidine kinase [Dehalogenimonas sp.]|nr:HAMP domain-containing sensor histidine kinase [Dehalogenimonas sp.]